MRCHLYTLDYRMCSLLSDLALTSNAILHFETLISFYQCLPVSCINLLAIGCALNMPNFYRDSFCVWVFAIFRNRPSLVVFSCICFSQRVHSSTIIVITLEFSMPIHNDSHAFSVTFYISHYVFRVVNF